MIRYARSQETLLTYGLRTVPGVVNVSAGDDRQTVRLELTVGGRADAPAECEWIRIALPFGVKPEDLTVTAPEDLWTGTEGGSAPGHGGGWDSTVKREGEQLVVTFEPGREPVFDGTFQVTFVVSYIVVNEAVGTATISVTESTAPASGGGYQERATTFPVNKWPADFHVGNFRPDQVTVGNGERVTLTWERSRGPAYVLHWGENESQDVSQDSSWVSLPLERTTGFMLVATDDSNGGAPLVHALTTAVTVERPNLLVGDLDVNGTTRLQGARQQVAVPAVSTSQFYRAGTDGTLLGFLQAASGAAGSTLAATVYRAGANEYTMRFTSDNSSGPPTETPVSIPVPEGAEVLLHFGGQNGDTLQLVWLPQGAGTFEVIDR
ncbi:hypothetical protein [Streptomyces sp. I05A-00742]|uniref:hypothetical protein n=1 Tax=Streptomyces sp. I05A-00742 TaxID=2732853 RepID=UPI0014887F7E|nr:hypothetical protein [Streptomyces sp. I05A-00742]